MTCKQIGKGYIKTASVPMMTCAMNVGGINDDICHAHVCTYKGLTNLWSSILCDKECGVALESLSYW
jgi:hypothetical protein